MKIRSKIATLLLLVFCMLSTAFPCGPGYISPVFDTSTSPEYPYTDYAAGRIGIVKPGFRRSILIAAYRYMSGGSFSPDEQKAMIEMWRDQINRDYTQKDDVGESVKLWLAKRKEVLTKEEKIPEIYVERSYGGYDFFPNCTKNAFETAAETLGDRMSAHGPNDLSVMDWVNSQDEVFQNCANGKQIPNDANAGAPTWLHKDRAYQKAAAEFYSLDYVSAKKHFAEIALDTESPWAETADYLVARTLIRQASLTPSVEKAKPFYEEAETKLERFTSRTGKFSASASRLLGLVKYRLHPKERVSELAKILAFQSGNENFKQDIVDYTWLLDKFESEVLEAEAKRKAALEAAKNGEKVSETPEATPEPARNDDRITFTLYSEDYSKNWEVSLKADATDAQAITETERLVGKPLTETQKNTVRTSRASAYSSRFTENRRSDYEGGYYSEDTLNLSSLPTFLRNDELTDWLFTFQTKSPEAYLYSLKKFTDSGSELWLMTALSKSEPSFSGIPRLLEAANNVSRTSPGYQTIAYHQARILLDLNKNVEAKKVIDEALQFEDQLPISSKNSFIDLRRRVAENLDDLITNSLRKPYAWDFSGSFSNIDDMIAREKTYFDPEYNKEGREAFEKEVEERFTDEKLWQDRQMLDSAAIDLMNRSFPQNVLRQVEQSPALPDYLRPKFAIAIWTRAWLLDDTATLLAMTPELVKYEPEFAPQLETITSARTQAAQDRAILYFILKNPVMSPYVEDGIGKSDNEFGMWDSNDWWCSSYLAEPDAETAVDETAPVRLKIPKFLTPEQQRQALNERKRLIALGDAPEMLGKKVLDWAKRFPTDKRVPEALYIVYSANGWTKYGCGSNEDLQTQIEALLRKSYPANEWTRKIDADKAEQ